VPALCSNASPLVNQCQQCPGASTAEKSLQVSIRQQSACYTHLVCKKCTECFRACKSVEFVPLPLLIKSFDATNVGKLSQRSDGINCNYGKIRVCLFQLLRFYWKSSYSFVMMATHGPVARITYTVLVVLVETLNPAQSINQSISDALQSDKRKTFVSFSLKLPTSWSVKRAEMKSAVSWCDWIEAPVVMWRHCSCPGSTGSVYQWRRWLTVWY